MQKDGDESISIPVNENGIPSLGVGDLSITKWSNDETSKRLGSMMRLILLRNLAGKPCTTKDIELEIFSDGTSSRGPLAALARLAEDSFLNLFNYRLIIGDFSAITRSNYKKYESDAQKRKNAGVFFAADLWYLVLNENDRNMEDETEDDKTNPVIPLRGLLMTCLGLIMLAEDGKLEENALLHHLGRLKIETNRINELLKELVGQDYLGKKKQTSGDRLTFYSFGARSMVEIPLKNIVYFMRQVTREPISVEDEAKLIHKIRFCEDVIQGNGGAASSSTAGEGGENSRAALNHAIKSNQTSSSSSQKKKRKLRNNGGGDVEDDDEY